MPQIISFISQKGGSGKTTCCANVAAALGKRGRSVLVLDIDPQRSLETYLRPLDAPDATVSILHQGENRVRGPIDPANTIKEIAQLKDDPKLFDLDYILIDAPPSLDNEALSAAMVSDMVVVPCGASSLDIGATASTLDVIRQVRAKRGGRYPILAVQPTRIQSSTSTAKVIESELAQLFSEEEKNSLTLGWGFVLPPIGLRNIFSQSWDWQQTVMDCETASSKAVLEIERTTDRIERTFVSGEKYHHLEGRALAAAAGSEPSDG